MNASRLYSIAHGTNAESIASIFDVLAPDVVTVLDATIGNGQFWPPETRLQVTGMDIDPVRARDLVGDFRALPFADGTFDAVVFDPPFHTDMGKTKASVMGARFKTFETLAELRPAFEQGCRESWRVARLAVVVKLQDYVHESRKVWMSRWAWDAMPAEPYDVVHLESKSKIIDRKWSRQLSVWSSGPSFVIWRKDGAVHRARGAAS